MSRPSTAWRRMLAAAALCGLGAAVLAQTGQDCRLDSPSTVHVDRYRPDSAPVATAWTLRVRSTRSCAGRLQIEGLSEPGRLQLSASTGAADNLLLSLSAQPGGTEPVAAAPLDAATVLVGAQQDQVLRWWLRPDPGQWLAAGLWQQTLIARLVDEQGRTLDAREVRISIPVDATVRAQFADAGGSRVARLDFGQLQQGARRATTLEVQANTAHSVTLESTQKGKLTNARAPQSPPIDWTLRLNGQAVGLAAPARLPFLGAGRQRHVLDAEIGSIERVLAGEYRDELQITITAQ